MSAPRCKLCGSTHWSHEPHRYSAVSNTGVSNSDANRVSEWRARNRERYNAYMREYMRNRRAGT